MITLQRRRLLGATTATLALAALPRVPAAAKVMPLNFVILGDWGRGGADKQREVGAQMGRTAAAIGSRFVISVGDNFYEHGVTGIDDPQWQDSFESIYDAPSLQTPWHVILGNHDYRGNVEAQLRYGDTHPRWRMPARYFVRTETLPDGTPADLFFIDTSPMITSYRFTKVRIDDQDVPAQLAWLDAALGRSTAPWKIVIGHHPIRTATGVNHDQQDLVDRLLPILQAHRVKLYINGHVHNLQVVEHGGVTCITCGAGSLTSRVKLAGPGQFSSDQHGFMTTALTAEAFAFSFVNEAGTTLYEASLARV
jgi:acid phosphatase